MPTINNIKISDAEFTAMQEKATAWVLKRAFEDNQRFSSPESIIKDSKTKRGLSDIFSYQNRPLFQFSLPLETKGPEAKWLNTFYLQQKKMLQEFAGAEFTVFNREGGFMDFITDIIKDKYGVARKDSWNPADIWLIKKKNVFREKIRKELEGPSGTQSIKELNAIMRSMFQKREVVGISLKLISGQQAQYEEVNVSESFFKKLENVQGEYNFVVSRILQKR